MNRRKLLQALVLPLILRPSLEEIERLTYRRKYWPGYAPNSYYTGPREFDVYRDDESGPVFMKRLYCSPVADPAGLVSEGLLRGSVWSSDGFFYRGVPVLANG